MMIANVSRPKFKIIAIILLIAFWAGACSTIPEQALTQTVEVVATDLPEISTATVAVVDTPTAVSEEPEPTRTATPVIFPTLGVEEAKEEVRALIAGNGGCDLPCWWGITPGDTLWSDVEPYLVSIANEVSFFSKSDLHENNIRVPFDIFIFYKRLDEFPRDIGVAFSVNPEGVIVIIASDTPATLKNFQITQLLLDYGNPEEIKVDLLTEFTGGGVYYTLDLFYPAHGFVAAYEGEGEVVENKMRVCPDEIGPYIHVIPSQKLSVSSFIRSLEQAGWKRSYNVPSINEFPELSIESFAELMKDPSACVYFPLE